MSSAARTGIVVIAVSRNGAELAAHLWTTLPAARALVPARFAKDSVEAYSAGVREVVAAEFAGAAGLVLVMAAGIAVRAVAPLLRDKRSDPAVVVVDDAGRFVISLLAGHAGGANALAEQVARVIGATPVITTASESLGLPAPDLLGRDRGWRIDAGSDLTRVPAALVNGDPVGVVQECGGRDWLAVDLPPHVAVYDSLEALNSARPVAALIVSDRAAVAARCQTPYALYRPPVLALGAGASRGAPAAELIELAEAALAEADLAAACVGAVATIDLKRDEPAIVALAGHFGVPLRTFSAAALDAAPGCWNRSDVVRAAVGAGGVCEPAALLAAKAVQLTITKRKSAHATVAVARAAEELCEER